MRKLTAYELRVLIKNEAENMYDHGFVNNNTDVNYIQARAQDILKYAEEYFALGEE